MDFDHKTDRTVYPTMKWDKSRLLEHFGNDDLMPFWVADMDFPAPDAVIESLQKRVQHGIYGYEYKEENYLESLTAWYEKRHGWQLNPDHIEFCPGVLNAVSIFINQHSDERDGIIIQPPVFFEFGQLIVSNNRRRVKNPLKLVDGRYEMDFEDLEEKASDPNNKLMILCNPHNPVGRVWTKEELSRAGEICRKHNVLVISDEIHGDITYGAHQYTPFASLSDELAQISLTCLSPAKTFNIAGMVDAMALIPDDDKRAQFNDFAHRYQINKNNVFAAAAVIAAYTEGEAWLDELLDYLQSNIDYLRTFFAEQLPQVKLIEPEGTYLVWLDFTALKMDAKDLERFLVDTAGIALNSGYWFGREGAGYARMNIACPQSILEEAMPRLKIAIDELA